MTITTTADGSTTTLAIEGWLDTTTAPELAAALDGLDPSCEKLTIDCSKLEYISSAGLRQLVAAHKKVKGNMNIVNVSSEVLEVIRMTGLAKRLNIA